MCVCFVVCGFVYVCVVQRDTHFLQLVCGVLCWHVRLRLDVLLVLVPSKYSIPSLPSLRYKMSSHHARVCVYE
jgi:hypothetical protein